jgi:methyl-accepting chemotaxis protein
MPDRLSGLKAQSFDKEQKIMLKKIFALLDCMKISHKLFLGFGVILLLFGGALTANSLHSLDLANNYEDLLKSEIALSESVTNLNERMLLCIKTEKEFLLAPTPEKQKEFNSNMKRLDDELEKIKDISMQMEIEKSMAIALRVEKSSKKYKKRFENLAATIKKNGFNRHSGLKGKFKKIADQLNEKMKRHQLEKFCIMFYQIRNYEKDYLRTGDEVFKNNLFTKFFEFQEALNSYKNPKLAEVLNKELDAYFEAFNSLDEKNKKAIEDKITNSAKKIENHLKTVYAPRCETYVLNIQNSEKDYMINGKAEDLEKNKKYIGDLLNIFVNSEINQEYKNEIVAILKEYRENFDLLLLNNKLIAQNITEMEKCVQNFENGSRTLLEQCNVQKEIKVAQTREKSQNILWALSGISALVALIAISSAGFISKGITCSVNAISGKLNACSGHVTSAAQKMLTTSQELASQSSVQAAELQEASSALCEVSSSAEFNADSALKADSQAKAAKTQIEQGSAVISQMDEGMQKIESSANQINDIMKTIDEIAFQTNLLALNAAVEAARAGDAGRGFSVLSEEIRRLSSNAGEAAKRTKTLIENTKHSVQNGGRIVKDLHKKFDKLEGLSINVAQLSSAINEANRTQAERINLISKAIANIEQNTASNAAVSQETASCSNELESQTKELDSLSAELNKIAGKAANNETTEKTKGFSVFGKFLFGKKARALP